MTLEMLLSLGEEASIVLATDNHAFKGESQNAAEYVYFKAIREGRIDAPYWIEEALDIVEIDKSIDLEHATLDEQPKEEDDGQQELQA